MVSSNRLEDFKVERWMTLRTSNIMLSSLAPIPSSVKKHLFFVLFVIALSCKDEKPKAWIDLPRLQNQDAADWLTTGGNGDMHHYSPLNEINRTNVKDLGFAWEYDASTYIGNVPRGLEATPIVVDGMMYTSGAWGAVYALDAKTGKQFWKYEPKVDPSYVRRSCCDVVNRGVAVWEGKIYVGTLDGFLVCLNAKMVKYYGVPIRSRIDQRLTQLPVLRK